MGIIDNLVSWWRAEPRAQQAMLEQRAAIASAVNPAHVGKAQWLPQNIRTMDRQGYRKVALLFRAIQYVSSAAGSAPMRVYEDDSGTGEALNDHPMRVLMRRPNAGMGEARFIAFVAMSMQVANFAVIEKERDRAGRVIGLWPLRPDWLRPIPRAGGAPDWEYRVPGYIDPKVLKAKDAIAIPYADTPDLSFTGIGPLEVILHEAQVSGALTDFIKVFMDRGAMPLYVMMPSDDPEAAAQWDDPATIEVFREAFAQRYQGLPNAVDPLPLVGIKDIKPLGFSFDELALPELNDLTDAHICTAFGVPPVLVGAQVGLDQATYSNYGQARRSFYEDTMFPFWGRLDDAFTRDLLPEFDTTGTLNIQFDTSQLPALRDDVDKAWERSTKAFLAGEISRHVSQQIKGVDVHGEDVFLEPFSANRIPVTDGQQRSRVTGTVREPRALPPVIEDGGIEPISEDEIDAALAWFDDSFPEIAGLLDAEVD